MEIFVASEDSENLTLNMSAIQNAKNAKNANMNAMCVANVTERAEV